jgi:hypothetical protein
MSKVLGFCRKCTGLMCGRCTLAQSRPAFGLEANCILLNLHTVARQRLDHSLNRLFVSLLDMFQR